MTTNDMMFRIEGEAGQGVESGSQGFAQAMARSGLHLFGNPDYMSRIRGGFNYFDVRVHSEPIYSQHDDVHLLLALRPESAARHQDSIVRGGGVICDETFEVDREALSARDIQYFPVPLFKIADEAGGRIMANTAAFGAAAGVTGFDVLHLESVVRENFQKKGQEIIDANLQVVRRAYEYTRDHYAGDFDYKLAPVRSGQRRMLLNGNQAFCLGALFGGCRFVSAYPMTPATPIIEWFARHADRYGLVTKHSEDELAAILMAIGANYAGVRAMTATSGGGFSLMTEALGLAGITETPLVVVESQRPGPATGMPTRTEQADLLFALNASQGEFPRIVLCPGTTEECFDAGWQAFNLAERYQTPVIVLLDNYLSNAFRTVSREDLHYERVQIDHGRMAEGEAVQATRDGYFRRYAASEDGISPRVLPGNPNAVVLACSDEHDEHGHFEDEDAANRVMMVDKRMRKLETAKKDVSPPTRYGPEQAETTLVCWGSTYGPARIAVDWGNAEGRSLNMVHFSQAWPLPAEAAQEMLGNAKHLVAVESNATGQFARMLRGMTGIYIQDKVLRYDGRPLTPGYILSKLP
ncbi:MAG: 2-oxoacid:acceptor oxidoreductase subunit alpha [Anaerolineae bacterium]